MKSERIGAVELSHSRITLTKPTLNVKGVSWFLRGSIAAGTPHC